MWDMATEDYEHRQRRVGMYQSQKMNHGQISAIFEQEELTAKREAEQRQRVVQEAQIQEAIQAEIHDKKMEILQIVQRKNLLKWKMFTMTLKNWLIFYALNILTVSHLNRVTR